MKTTAPGWRRARACSSCGAAAWPGASHAVRSWASRSACCCRRTDRGRMLAALNLGHFGVKVHRSDDAGATWKEVATPTYPEQPPDATGAPWKLVQIWSLEAAQWHGLGRHLARRAVPLRRLRRQLAAGALAVGPPRATGMVRRRLRRARHPLDLPAPGERRRAAAGHQLRRRLGHARRRRELGAAGRRHACRLPAARAGRLPEHPGPAPHRACRRRIPTCCGASTIAASGAAPTTPPTWVEVKAPLSSFGFGVAVHPHDPDTAWFVPGVADQQRVPVDGAVVVNRTRDGGRSFETLRAGPAAVRCLRPELPPRPDGRRRTAARC